MLNINKYTQRKVHCHPQYSLRYYREGVQKSKNLKPADMKKLKKKKTILLKQSEKVPQQIIASSGSALSCQYPIYFLSI